MRVLYFSDNVSAHNQRFLRKLAASNHEVWFCDFTSSSLRPDWLPHGVRPYSLIQTAPRSAEPTEVLALLPQVQKMISDVKPDLIHAGPVQTCGYLIAVAQFHPLLLTSWGSDILLSTERGESWREATRVAVSGADALFVDSKWVLERARAFGEMPDDRVVMFPWGIEQGRFAPAGSLPEQFEHEPGTRALLCTRTWEELYGMDTLLRSFLLAYKKNPALRLFLIGGGSQETFIRQFIQVNGLDRVVTIPGFLDGKDLPAWFRAADGYISCAKADGTSISLLEAMATGLPAIVTDIPSNREWVTPDVNGWLASDDIGFANAMLRVGQLQRVERNAISIANRNAVADRADWDKNFPKLLSMYEYLQAHPRKAFRTQPSSM